MADAFAPFTFVHSNRRVVFGWDSLDRLPELAKEFGARRPAAILDGYFTRTPVGALIRANTFSAARMAAAPLLVMPSLNALLVLNSVRPAFATTSLPPT